MDWIKEWWPVMVGFFLAAVGWSDNRNKGDTTRRDLDAIIDDRKKEKFVTDEICLERRAQSNEYNRMIYSQTERRFTELKDIMAENARKNEDAQREIYNILREMNKNG